MRMIKKLKNNSLIKDNRGVSLLITLTIVMLITSIALNLHREVRFAVHGVAAERDRITTDYMASSGVNMAIAILLKDMENTKSDQVDSIQEDWANPEYIESVINENPFEEGKLSIEITDELAKIQINSLLTEFPGNSVNDEQKKLWSNILGFVISSDKSEDSRDAESIINSIIDWLDENDFAPHNGAESDYYQDLENPYDCRNGQMNDINEIFKIKDVDKDLFDSKGMMADLKESNLAKAAFGDEIAAIPEISTDVSEYLTVNGTILKKESNKIFYEGKININTADLPLIIALLPQESSNIDRYFFGKAIYDYRDEVNEEGDYVNELTGKWYESCTGCVGSGIEKIKILTTSSNVFKIKCSAKLNQVTSDITAVVVREKDTKSGKYYCRTISYRSD